MARSTKDLPRVGEVWTLKSFSENRSMWEIMEISPNLIDCTIAKVYNPEKKIPVITKKVPTVYNFEFFKDSKWEKVSDEELVELGIRREPKVLKINFKTK